MSNPNRGNHHFHLRGLHRKSQALKIIHPETGEEIDLTPSQPTNLFQTDMGSLVSSVGHSEQKEAQRAVVSEKLKVEKPPDTTTEHTTTAASETDELIPESHANVECVQQTEQMEAKPFVVAFTATKIDAKTEDIEPEAVTAALESEIIEKEGLGENQEHESTKAIPHAESINDRPIQSIENYEQTEAVLGPSPLPPVDENAVQQITIPIDDESDKSGNEEFFDSRTYLDDEDTGSEKSVTSQDIEQSVVDEIIEEIIFHIEDVYESFSEKLCLETIFDNDYMDDKGNFEESIKTRFPAFLHDFDTYGSLYGESSNSNGEEIQKPTSELKETEATKNNEEIEKGEKPELVEQKREIGCYDREFMLKCYQSPKTRMRPIFLFKSSAAVSNNPTYNLLDILMKRKSPGERRAPSPVPKQTNFQNRRPHAGGRHIRFDLRRQQQHREVKLHKANNPYKVVDPSQLTNRQRIAKHFREILNKISADNEDELLKEISDIEFETPEDVLEPLEILVDKATYEVHFRAIYAKVAQFLSTKLTFRNVAVGSTTFKFKRELLKQIEKEFLADFALTPKLIELARRRNAAVTQKEKKHLESCYNDERSIRKRKYIGLVEFIGHLYMVNVVNTEILASCTGKLLMPWENRSSIEEWQIESVIHLLVVLHEHLYRNGNGKLVADMIDSTQNAIKTLEDSRRVQWMFDDLVKQVKESKRTQSAAPTSRVAPKQSVPVKSKQSKAELRAEIATEIEKFMKGNNTETAADSLCRIVSKVPTAASLTEMWAEIVIKGYDMACDRGETKVVCWANVLRKLVKEKSMPVKGLVEGIHEFWKLAEELVLDVPMLYQYVGASFRVLEDLLEDGSGIDRILSPIKNSSAYSKVVDAMTKQK